MIALLGIDFRGSPVELAAAGAVLLSALGYAGAALVYRRWLADVPAIGVTALMTAISSVAFLAPAAVNLPREVPPASSILALVTLGIINTGPAYWLFYLLIDQAGAATASVITYVMPVVALVLGVALLEEQLTIGAIAGLPLIGLGAWLATSRHPPRHGTRADVQDGRSMGLAQQDRLGGETAGRLSKESGVDPHGTPQPGQRLPGRFRHTWPEVPHENDRRHRLARPRCLHLGRSRTVLSDLLQWGQPSAGNAGEGHLRWLPRERGMPGLRSGDPAGAWRVGWPW